MSGSLSGRAVRLLVIEDSVEDFELMLRALDRGGFAVTPCRVDTEGALVEALEHDWDAVVSDFSMPQFDGLAAFEIVRRHARDTPFIFLSGVLGEERAVMAMRAGARDYVLKSKLHRLGPVLARELAEADARRARTEIERELRGQQRRYQSIFHSAAIALVELDVTKDPRIVAANAAAVNLFEGDSPDALVELLSTALHPASRASWDDLLGAIDSGIGIVNGTFQKETKLESLRGRSLDVLIAFRVPTNEAERQNVVVSVIDVSERNSLERQMRAAQRMEAVGRLAGGVAHDFNNVLAVITSYTHFLLEGLPAGDPLRADAEVIRDAARRAAGLTRQLLAFSRRQVVEPRILDMNEIVRDMDRMLRRLLGEDIDLETTLAETLGPIEIDPSHIEQIMMNLVVNARDAMPRGGKLTIETEDVDLDEEYCAGKAAEVVPGHYGLIAVSDNGTGMDEDTRQHIFEPFFTTKEAGKGTGLGLSTVYGIVKQAGGFVWVYSEIGRGTTFRVYLPRKDGATAESIPRRDLVPNARGGDETILVVEDEELVRRATVRVLETAGYEVLAADGGKQALEVHEGHLGPIHALITDVVMPAMSGPELATELTALRPGIAVLYMSGYTRNATLHHGVLDRGVVLVQKPFTPADLLRKVREVIDGGGG